MPTLFKTTNNSESVRMRRDILYMVFPCFLCLLANSQCLSQLSSRHPESRPVSNKSHESRLFNFLVQFSLDLTDSKVRTNRNSGCKLLMGGAFMCVFSLYPDGATISDQ